jgi:DNA primase
MTPIQKESIDLVGVVEGVGVELKQRGTRHVGLCPFHSEKTPSFFIFPDNRFK